MTVASTFFACHILTFPHGQNGLQPGLFILVLASALTFEDEAVKLCPGFLPRLSSALVTPHSPAEGEPCPSLLVSAGRLWVFFLRGGGGGGMKCKMPLQHVPRQLSCRTMSLMFGAKVQFKLLPCLFFFPFFFFFKHSLHCAILPAVLRL